jgi:hypothetical protein
METIQREAMPLVPREFVWTVSLYSFMQAMPLPLVPRDFVWTRSLYFFVSQPRPSSPLFLNLDWVLDACARAIMGNLQTESIPQITVLSFTHQTSWLHWFVTNSSWKYSTTFFCQPKQSIRILSVWHSTQLSSLIVDHVEAIVVWQSISEDLHVACPRIDFTLFYHAERSTVSLPWSCFYCSTLIFSLILGTHYADTYYHEDWIIMGDFNLYRYTENRNREGQI